MHLENPRIFSKFDRECDRLLPLLPLQEVDGFHGQSLAPASPYLALSRLRRRDGLVGPSNHDGKEDQLMPFFQKMEKVI